MGMNFGEALQLINQGERVYREGWTAIKFIFFVPGSKFKVNRPPLLGIYEEGTDITYHSHIDAQYSDGTIGVCTIKQADILANDWLIHNP